jgi:DNA (cytosine-5)-methyltransferase 1
VFSGLGGFCEGAKVAGWNVKGAVEVDKYACHNYRLNFPNTPLYEGDICNFLVEGSPEFATQLTKFANDGDIDVVFGGFPCQGFSQIGPRDPKDPRNELYLQLIRIAKTINAPFILMENVPNMFMMKKGMFKKRIFDSLDENGYVNHSHTTLLASEYGVPQSRKRIFILASNIPPKNNISLKGLLMAVSSTMQISPVSTKEALSDLPEIIADDSGVELNYPVKKVYTAYQKEMRITTNGQNYKSKEKRNHLMEIGHRVKLHNHHTKDIQEKRFKLLKLLKPGCKADSLPVEIWNNARPEKWRRFSPDLPAHTLLAQMHRDMSEWIHYDYDRWITVREALRLQSFHDGFVLETSEWQQLKQVGNAVPPLLAKIPCIAVSYLATICGLYTLDLPKLDVSTIDAVNINSLISVLVEC